MFETIFAKTVWERRKSIFWWMLGLAALAAVTVAFFPAIRDDAESFESLFDSFSPELLAIFGIDDHSALLTATGLINSRIYAGIGPVILAVLAITIGTAAIVGEEERGTLNLLLAQPVSRTYVVVQKTVAAAVLLAVPISAIFLTLSALNPVIGLDLEFTGLLAANVTLWLFALAFYMFTLAISAVTGSRSITIGAAAGTTAALFFINGLAPLVESIAWIQKLTPFYWLQNPNPLANGFDIAAIAIFVVISAVLLGVAIWSLERRDIGI